ncbi:SURF1 family protein [Humidisolicoccus flavus]|uniref:SURF1 family protein n=1 Tax=Humidisolicoccus flavus TaxID=3111414 RepID=UPI00324A0FB0
MQTTFWQMARKPRWIGVLFAALFVSAVFSLLGQWQIERAVEGAQRDTRDTETPMVLADLEVPGQPMTSEAGGRMVTATGEWASDRFVVLEGRQHEGAEGFWVVGSLVSVDGNPDVSLAVALGWAPTLAEAEAVAAMLAENPPSGEMLGRYMPSEHPIAVDVEAQERDAMSVAMLINLWPDFEGLIYPGYVITEDTPAGLTAIVSVPPLTDVQLNWLNVFYAIEWIVFALFAFYLWYRLVKDAIVREREAAEEGDDDWDDDWDDDPDGDGPLGDDETEAPVVANALSAQSAAGSTSNPGSVR